MRCLDDDLQVRAHVSVGRKTCQRDHHTYLACRERFAKESQDLDLAAASPLKLDLVERPAVIALIAAAAGQVGEEDEVPRETWRMAGASSQLTDWTVRSWLRAHLSKMIKSGVRPSSPSGLSSVGRKMCSSLDSKSCGRFSPTKKNGWEGGESKQALVQQTIVGRSTSFQTHNLFLELSAPSARGQPRSLRSEHSCCNTPCPDETSWRS